MGLNQAGAANTLPEEGDDAPRAAEPLSGTESPASAVAGVAEGVAERAQPITFRVRGHSVYDFLARKPPTPDRGRFPKMKKAYAS